MFSISKKVLYSAFVVVIVISLLRCLPGSVRSR